MAGLGKEQQGGQDSGLKQGQEHTGNLGLATRPGGKASGLEQGQLDAKASGLEQGQQNAQASQESAKASGLKQGQQNVQGCQGDAEACGQQDVKEKDAWNKARRMPRRMPGLVA